MSCAAQDSIDYACRRFELRLVPKLISRATWFAGHGKKPSNIAQADREYPFLFSFFFPS